MTPDVIDNFRGRWEPLSNFARIPVTLYSGLERREVTYPTSEHAFNAAKTIDPRERAWVAAAPSPREAKARGHQVTLRRGWDERVRYAAMRLIVAAKFAPGTECARLLIATGDADLIEGNRWHDQHWGDCRCGRPACSAPGQNWLGRILAEQRAALMSMPKTREF